MISVQFDSLATASTSKSRISVPETRPAFDLQGFVESQVSSFTRWQTIERLKRKTSPILNRVAGITCKSTYCRISEWTPRMVLYGLRFAVWRCEATTQVRGCRLTAAAPVGGGAANALIRDGGERPPRVSRGRWTVERKPKARIKTKNESHPAAVGHRANSYHVGIRFVGRAVLVGGTTVVSLAGFVLRRLGL